MRKSCQFGDSISCREFCFTFSKLRKTDGTIINLIAARANVEARLTADSH